MPYSVVPAMNLTKLGAGLIFVKAMGLGKTLTMLAVILNSLEDLSTISGDFSMNIPVKQTLIITPLSCESVEMYKVRIY